MVRLGLAGAVGVHHPEFPRSGCVPRAQAIFVPVGRPRGLMLLSPIVGEDGLPTCRRRSSRRVCGLPRSLTKAIFEPSGEKTGMLLLNCDVTCERSVPSGFIVKMLTAPPPWPEKAMRPLARSGEMGVGPGAGVGVGSGVGRGVGCGGGEE